MLRLQFLLILLLTLGACTTGEVELSWPNGIPPQSFFRAEWRAATANREYQGEEEYLLWVVRFYEGDTRVPGWIDITVRILERLPESEHAWVAGRLSELGGRIAREWAKDNSVRRLNTRSAAVWRDVLLEALARGELPEYLDRLSDDVDALLAGKLDNDLIRFERYYVDKFDF